MEGWILYDTKKACRQKTESYAKKATFLTNTQMIDIKGSHNGGKKTATYS